MIIKIFLPIIFALLVSCNKSSNNVSEFSKPFYSVSLEYGFKPNKVQYETLKNGSWIRHRDHFFYKNRTNLLIQTIIDSTHTTDFSIKEVLQWAYDDFKRTEIIDIDTLDLNGLFTIKTVLTKETYDIAYDNYTKFYETSWTIRGTDKIFFVKLNSDNETKYNEAVHDAERMVSSFREK